MWMSSGMEVGLLQLTDFLSLGDVHARKKGKCSFLFPLLCDKQLSMKSNKGEICI